MNHLRRTLSIATLAACTGLGFLPGVVQAGLLVNGDFETQSHFVSNPFPAYPHYVSLFGSQLPGWTIEPLHSVTVHNTALQPGISGGFTVNTDGEGINGRNSDFYQDFASALGTPYQLDFDWKGWSGLNPPRLNVSIQDTVTSAYLWTGSFSSVGGLSVVHHETANFAGTGNPLRLRVRHSPASGFNDNAFLVDNFSVIAVPEPSTLMLAALGGAGLLVGVWRQRRAAIG